MCGSQAFLEYPHFVYFKSASWHIVLVSLNLLDGTKTDLKVERPRILSRSIIRSSEGKSSGLKVRSPSSRASKPEMSWPRSDPVFVESAPGLSEMRMRTNSAMSRGTRSFSNFVQVRSSYFRGRQKSGRVRSSDLSPFFR